jgi:hypothetical protein
VTLPPNRIIYGPGRAFPDTNTIDLYPVGQILYDRPGTWLFKPPTGVTSVSAVCIGGECLLACDFSTRTALCTLMHTSEASPPLLSVLALFPLHVDSSSLPVRAMHDERLPERVAGTSSRLACADCIWFK